MWIVALALSAHGTEIGTRRPFGLGVQLGAPTGITGKVYLGGRRNALDFLVGGAYYDNGSYWGGFWGQVSYHWAVATLANTDGVDIPFRIGVGGFVSNHYYQWVDGPYDAVIGARVPFGLDFDLDDAPVQFYLELAIDVTVLPPLGVGADAGFGVRYYF